MIPVGWLAPGDQWDTVMVEDLLSNRLYETRLKFKHHAGYPPGIKGCVLVIPSRYWVGHEAEISTAIGKYKWVLAFRTSDEEDLFDVGKVEHPNLRWWIQTPRTDRPYPEGSRFIGVGYTPHFRNLPNAPPARTIPVFLAAQNTHIRRRQCFTALEGVSGRLEQTDGFTQGMDPLEYRDCMLSAKVAPAPSGAVSPDSFRFWEALEAHAVPIADTVSPVDGPTDYWNRLFPDAPFPILTHYQDLSGYINDCLDDWPRIGNRVTAWWTQQKRRYAHWLIEDLKALGAL